MKKFTGSSTVLYLFLLLTLSSETLWAQSYKFAWLTDLHVGAPGAVHDLSTVVDSINGDKSLAFTVITGDVTEKGMNTELDSVKMILNKLTIPVFIIPGNHDTKWSESGGRHFRTLWGDDKFAVHYENTLLIGMNSGILWRGGGGHIQPKDLIWLDSVLTAQKTPYPVFFFVHHPLDADIDNWFKVTNILRQHNIKAVFCGHGHQHKQMQFNGIPGIMGGATYNKGAGGRYTVVKVDQDSLQAIPSGNIGAGLTTITLKKNTKLTIPAVDSVQFKNYSANVIWKKELNTLLPQGVVTYNKGIITADYYGTINHFDAKGNSVWKYEANRYIGAMPVVSMNTLYYGTLSGDLTAISMDNATPLQSVGLNEPVTSRLTIIKSSFFGEQADAVIAGTGFGSLFCYEALHFSQLWVNNSAQGMIESRPIQAGKQVIMGAWDGHLYSIDSEKGLLNWKWSENKNFYYSPAAADPVTDGKYIYIPTPDKAISAVDVLLGKTKWRNTKAGAFESLGISNDGKTLAVKNIEDTFTLFQAGNGKKIKDFKLPKGVDTNPITPIETKSGFLFGTKSGHIYLLEKRNKLRPVLFLGTSRVHTITRIDPATFAAATMDGVVVLFTLK